MCVAGIRREEHGKGKRELFCTCAKCDITDRYNREVGLWGSSVILTDFKRIFLSAQATLGVSNSLI